MRALSNLSYFTVFVSNERQFAPYPPTPAELSSTDRIDAIAYADNCFIFFHKMEIIKWKK